MGFYLFKGIRFLYTCEVSVEAWFLFWSVAVCDTIGDCLRLTYSDDPQHHGHVLPIYLNGREDSKRTDGNYKKITEGIRCRVNYMNYNYN